MSSDSSTPDNGTNIAFLTEPEHPGAKKLWDYWHTKAAGRPMPDRADINLADLSDIAPNLLISETVGDNGDFRIRLYGSNVTDITGEERTGKLLTDIGKTSGGSVRARWQAVTREAARTGRPVCVKAAGSRQDTEHLIFHGLAMPLTNGGDRIEQFIGGLFVSYLSDEKPRR